MKDEGGRMKEKQRRGPSKGARILPNFSNSSAKPPKSRDFYRFLRGRVYGEAARGGKDEVTAGAENPSASGERLEPARNASDVNPNRE